MYSKLLSTIVFFLIFLPVLFISGQEKNKLQFTHIGKEAGLESPYISDIIQDNQGFLWICTIHSQLYRYDGINLKSFLNDPNDPTSLPNFQYSQMILDNNHIWLGSEKGIVDFNLETETFTYYKLDFTDTVSYAGNFIMSMLIDHKGMLWLGTVLTGLYSFNMETGAYTHYLNDPANPDSIMSNNIRFICEDQTGEFWIGTNIGFDNFNPDTGKFSHTKYSAITPEGLFSDYIYSVINDKDGKLWFATGSALKSYDPVKKEYKEYILKIPGIGTENQTGFDLVYEGVTTGKLWVVAFKGLLYEFDRQKEEFIFYARHDPADPTSFAPAAVTVILEDRSGMLWISGIGGFLNAAKIFKKEFKNMHFMPDNPDGFQGTTARNFAEDKDGLLWIVASGGGLQAWDRKSGRIVKRYKSDPLKPEIPDIDDTFSLLIDKMGDIWMISRIGLYRFTPKTETFNLYKDTSYGIYMLYEDRSGTIWGIGTNISLYNREKNQFVPLVSDPVDPGHITPNQFFSIYEDSSGAIWLSSSNDGLVRYNREKKNFTYYKPDPQNPKSLPTFRLLSIFEDHNHILWLASLDGIVRFDPEKEEFHLYNRSDGLGSNTTYNILEDDNNNLWIITQVGVSKFDPIKGIFRNYDTSDGILSGDYFSRAYKSRDGYIFFGGGGVNYFYPPDINDNLYLPPVRIFDLKLFNKSVPIGEYKKERIILSKSMPYTSEIVLLYSDYVFSLEFAALSFLDAAKNQYAYKLDGFENEWNYSGARNFATYTNLAAGFYTFRVKAANNDGYWNEKETTLKIRVLPPFWETWWFRSLMILLLLCLIAFGFIYTIIKLRIKHKEQLIKHEVEIARNIQLALLPDINLIQDTGYEFEGSMQIATTVGGDYYDVTRGIDGRLWLGIGDVAGHGISAGLVMMMAQVAIHNLLGNVPGISPAEMLSQANKIITKNVRERMRTDQHMTINFMVENDPGCFDFAGAHEVILIYRAETGQVEWVETDGFWLGILEDCTFQMSRGKGNFQLKKGDTLLLYTDGVIETMNKEREQFDLHRLIEVMRHNCENPAALKHAINTALLHDFGGIQKDDITFLICKRR